MMAISWERTGTRYSIAHQAAMGITGKQEFIEATPIYASILKICKKKMPNITICIQMGSKTVPWPWRIANSDRLV